MPRLKEIQASGQIDRFHYTVGAFYFQDGGYTQNPQSFFEGGAVENSQYGYGTQNYAAYTQVDYNPPVLDDKLTITFGLRYNNETKTGSRFLAEGTAFAPLTTIISGVNQSKRLPIRRHRWPLSNMRIDDDTNVYVKYAEGFKSGGFNGEATTLKEAITPAFAPETDLDEYEVGIKSRWLDGKLNVKPGCLLLISIATCSSRSSPRPVGPRSRSCVTPVRPTSMGSNCTSRLSRSPG